MLLLQLPPELFLHIVENLDDVSSLQALARTCRTIYHSILAHEQIVSGRVLTNYVGEPGLMRELVLAFEARRQVARPRWEGWTFAEQMRFLAHYDGLEDERLVHGMSIARASGIARLCNVVRYFAGQCAEEGLRIGHQRYAVSHLPLEPRPSELELLRIQRTFCRMELHSLLFANLFANLYPRLPYSEVSNETERAVFWDRFAPWEHEQMASVFDYLHRSLLAVLDEMLTFEPESSALLPSRLDDGPDEPMVDFWLSCGLENLQQFCTSPSMRLAYLQEELVIGTESYTFFDSSRFATNPLTITPLRELSPDEERQVIKPAYHDDGDSGPETVWRWAHQEESPNSEHHQGFVLSYSQMALRECGYVFWDQRRIDRWNVLRQPWQREDRTADLREQRI